LLAFLAEALGTVEGRAYGAKAGVFGRSGPGGAGQLFFGEADPCFFFRNVAEGIDEVAPGLLCLLLRALLALPHALQVKPVCLASWARLDRSATCLPFALPVVDALAKLLDLLLVGIVGVSFLKWFDVVLPGGFPFSRVVLRHQDAGLVK